MCGGGKRRADAAGDIASRVAGTRLGTAAYTRIKTILFHKNFPVDIRHNARYSARTGRMGGERVVMNALVTGGGGFLGGADR